MRSLRSLRSLFRLLPAAGCALLLVLSLLATTGSPATAARRGPVNVAAPVVSGLPVAGEVLACRKGRWQGKASGFSFGWLRDGRPIAGARSRRYVVAPADEGSALGCRAKPRQASRAAHSAPVVVTAVPVNTVAPSITGVATPGSSLTCHPGGWSDAEEFDTYWKRDGSPAGTGSTYAVSAGDLGRTLECEVAARNPAGTSGRVGSAPVVVTADGTDPVVHTAAPQNTQVPTIHGVPHPGWTLTCDPGTWTGSAELSYAWTRNGSPAGDGTAAYALTPADVDTTLVCLVVGRNDAGASGAVASEGVRVVLPPSPGNTLAPTVTGTAEYDETLTCSAGAWTDHPLTYSYRWVRSGVVVGSVASTTATSITRKVTYAEIGRELTCEVDATNAGGTTTATSNTVVARPVNLAAPTVSGTPVVGSALHCAGDAWTVGPTHPVSRSYSWQRDGADIPGATAATYVATWDDADADVACTVVLTRLLATSAPVSSDEVRVLPKAPESTVAPAVTGLNRSGGVLTCEAGTWANFPTDYTFTWTRNGAVVKTETVPATTSTSTRQVAANDVGRELVCTVTATNTGGSGSGEGNPVVPVPTNTLAPSVSGATSLGSTLTCDPGSWDRGNSPQYTWQRDGVDIPGATSATYVLGAADSGAGITCSVAMRHLLALSDPVVSNTVDAAAARSLPGQA